MYFDLEMSELQKYITDDGNFEIDFSMMNTICMSYRLNVKVSSQFFNFEINTPSDTPITKHYKFPEDSELSHPSIEEVKNKMIDEIRSGMGI